MSDPDNLLFELLTDLYGIFKFFHLSFESFTKVLIFSFSLIFKFLLTDCWMPQKELDELNHNWHLSKFKRYCQMLWIIV